MIRSRYVRALGLGAIIVLMYTACEKDGGSVTPPVVTGPPDVLNLRDTTIATTSTFTATRLITVGPSVTVSSGADVSLVAGETIQLGPGFVVLEGGALRAVIN